jgi:hypothetical protein
MLEATVSPAEVGRSWQLASELILFAGHAEKQSGRFRWNSKR